jgi:hypothetical protein
MRVVLPILCSTLLAGGGDPVLRPLDGLRPAPQMQERASRVVYDSVRASHRALVTNGPCAVASNLKTKDVYRIASEHRSWSATVQETDPVVVPYDQARACIQLQGPNGSARSVSIGDFRTLRVQWVNERLLYVFTDVGRVAGVGQLLDVEDIIWLYARTELHVSAPGSAMSSH